MRARRGSAASTKLTLLVCAGLLALGFAQLAAPPRPLAAPGSAAALMALIDDDQDGAASTAELRRHADRLGPSLAFDLDGDGALQLAELDLLVSALSPHPPQPNALPGAL